MLRTELLYSPTVRRCKFKVNEVTGIVNFGEYDQSRGTQIDQVQLVARLERLFGIHGGAFSPDTLQVRHSAAAIPL